MKKNGFTLIEILIVVAIIGLLSTMGLVVFQTSLRRSRDARRISEVKSLQSAAEQYYADHGNSYPSADGCLQLSAYVQGFTVAGGAYVDPKARAYVCDFTPAGATWSYCVEALLEGTATTDGNSSINCNGVAVGPSSRYYLLRNLF